MREHVSCGFPDLSFHQEEAWKIDLSGDKRHIGMMFTELTQAKKEKETALTVGTRCTKLYYVALNMHWEEKVFSMPNLIKKAKWNLLLTTGDEGKKEEADGQIHLTVPGRTIVIYEAK
jgi:glycogen operon protein